MTIALRLCSAGSAWGMVSLCMLLCVEQALACLISAVLSLRA